LPWPSCPLLFCFAYACSILRDEPLWSADADPYSNFLGYLPYSDAADYCEGARRLVDIGELTNFNERRPANAAVAMIVVLMVAPGAARRLSRSPDTSCLTPGRLVLRHPSDEPSVLHAAHGLSGRYGVPLITPERLAAQRVFANNPLELGDPPALLHWAYDYGSHRLITLVAPPGLLETSAEFVWVETVPLGPSDTHRRVEHFGAWNGCDGGIPSGQLSR